MPCHPKAIGAVAMQKTGCVLTVKVDEILVRNRAEFIYVEVCVQTLQRIERPGHPRNPLRKYSFTLCDLEPKPEIMRTICRLDRQHMRVMDHHVAFKSDKPIYEASQFITVKGPHQHATGCFRGNKLCKRYDLDIGDSPDLLLQFLDRLHFGERVNFADHDRSFDGGVHC